jgi:hypothetical protein
MWVFPVGIGLRDPRSQKRDPGHPSISPFDIAESTCFVLPSEAEDLSTNLSAKPLHILCVDLERFHDRPLELFLLHEGMAYMSGCRRGGEDRLVVD